MTGRKLGGGPSGLKRQKEGSNGVKTVVLVIDEWGAGHVLYIAFRPSRCGRMCGLERALQA